MTRYLTPFIGLLFLLIYACKPIPKSNSTPQKPDFNSDTAYNFVLKQLQLGYRIPNTASHIRTIDFILTSLWRFGWKAYIQEGQMVDYAGEPITVRNIIADPDSSFYLSPPSSQRLLLCTHYDTRPWCDAEEDYSDRFSPVPGANDGASGTAVLLEIARQVQQLKQQNKPIHNPIQLVFFDAEDMGTPNFYTGKQRNDTWCLGSQLWSQKYASNPQCQYSYGILLDMVGDFNASFPMEHYSFKQAPSQTEQLWKTAQKLGYGNMFVNLFAPPIIDDHFYINKIGIPCVDIIHLDPYSQTGFPWWWHTKNDTLTQVSKISLQAVGEVMMYTIINNNG